MIKKRTEEVLHKHIEWLCDHCYYFIPVYHRYLCIFFSIRGRWKLFRVHRQQQIPEHGRFVSCEKETQCPCSSHFVRIMFPHSLKLFIILIMLGIRALLFCFCFYVWLISDLGIYNVFVWAPISLFISFSVSIFLFCFTSCQVYRIWFVSSSSFSLLIINLSLCRFRESIRFV